jgi:acetyl esterase/lipase
VITVALILLLIICLVFYRSAQSSQQAEDKANQLIAALQKAGIPVEMHLYAQGGHAFGVRPSKLPIAQWPHLVEAWLVTIGMVDGSIAR